MTQGIIFGQPDRAVLVSVILVDDPNAVCVPRGKSGPLGAQQTAEPDNSGLGPLPTQSNPVVPNDPYDLCKQPGAASTCVEDTHNSQQVKPTPNQQYGGATYNTDCIGGACWQDGQGNVVNDPRPVLPGGTAQAAAPPQPQFQGPCQVGGVTVNPDNGACPPLPKPVGATPPPAATTPPPPVDDTPGHGHCDVNKYSYRCITG